MHASVYNVLHLHDGAGRQHFLLHARVISGSSHSGEVAHGVFGRHSLPGSWFAAHNDRLVLLISEGDAICSHIPSQKTGIQMSEHLSCRYHPVLVKMNSNIRHFWTGSWLLDVFSPSHGGHISPHSEVWCEYFLIALCNLSTLCCCHVTGLWDNGMKDLASYWSYQWV